MTYQELITLGKPSCPVNTSLKVSKDTLEEPKYDFSEYPFQEARRLGGTIYLFEEYDSAVDTSFIYKIHKAFDTDCMESMTTNEINLLDAYFTWAYDGTPSSVFNTAVLVSLDAVISAQVTCATVPSDSDCTGDYTSNYVECP